jgi:hypothetical protein
MIPGSIGPSKLERLAFSEAGERILRLRPVRQEFALKFKISTRTEELLMARARPADVESGHQGGTEVTEEDTMRSVRFTDAILPGQSSPWPVAGDAAKAKALINFLMQDRFFLEHFRSDDPKVRAAAMDTLNKAHHQAYGDAPAADDDAAGGRH